MKRSKTNVFILLTVLATLIVFLSPFLGSLDPQDAASMTTAVGVMGAAYFGLVSPQRHKISPLVTLMFLGFAALSTSAVGILVYDGQIRALLLGVVFIFLVSMEIGMWFYTAVYEVHDVPPALAGVLPASALPDGHDKLNDPLVDDENLNKDR